MFREIILTESDIARFWDKVDVRGEDECWMWMAYRTPQGYGQLNVDGKACRANRVSLTIKLGRQIVKGLDAMHSCDHPSCVNPKHLDEGTRGDNLRDMADKGRMYFQKYPQMRAYGDKNGSRKYPERLPRGDSHWTHQHPDIYKGEGNPSAKLTWAKVREIRLLKNNGGLTNKELAIMYSVTKTSIQYIVNNKTWQE